METVYLRTYEGQEPEAVKVWAVFSTNPEKELAAAFYDEQDAQSLHEKLTDSEPPILMDIESVECLVDELKPLVRSGAQVFTVVLEDGRVVREDTFDDQVFNLQKPSFVAGHPELFVGTYWAFSIDEAIRKAEIQLKRMSE